NQYEGRKKQHHEPPGVAASKVCRGLNHKDARDAVPERAEEQHDEERGEPARLGAQRYGPRNAPLRQKFVSLIVLVIAVVVVKNRLPMPVSLGAESRIGGRWVGPLRKLIAFREFVRCSAP